MACARDEHPPATGARIARQSLGGIATNGAIQLISFGIGILVTRALGPEARGIYFLIMTFIGVVVTVGTLGLPNANMVFIAQRRYALGTLHANSIGAALALGGVAFLAYGLLHKALSGSILAGVPEGYIVWGLCQTPLLFYENFWSSLAIGMGRVGQYNLFLLWRTVGTALVVAGLFALRALNVESLLAVWTIANLAGVVWMAQVLLSLTLEPLRPSRAALEEALRFGLRLHLGGIATITWQRFDSFFLNVMHGAAAVGQYSLAVALTEGLWRVAGPVVNAIQHPVTSSGGEEACALTRRVLRHVTFILLILGGGLGVSAPWLIPMLYGQAFAPAVPATQILLVGTIGVGLAMVTSVYFVGVLNRGGLLSILAWLNAAVNISLCLVLIPRHGILGAAWASGVTYVFGVAVVLVWFRRVTASRWADMLALQSQDLADYGLLLRDLRAGWRR